MISKIAAATAVCSSLGTITHSHNPFYLNDQARGSKRWPKKVPTNYHRVKSNMPHQVIIPHLLPEETD